QPTDTCRALLSYKGVLHKDHLDRGVLKGALTQEQADKKFEAWLADKEGKIQGKKDMLSKSKEELEKAKLKAEQEAKDKKAAEIAAKNTPEPVAEEDAPAEDVEVAEETPAAEEKTEEIAAEAKEEAPAEEDKKED